MSLFKYIGIMQTVKEECMGNVGARKGVVNSTMCKGEGSSKTS